MKKLVLSLFRLQASFILTMEEFTGNLIVLEDSPVARGPQTRPSVRDEELEDLPSLAQSRRTPFTASRRTLPYRGPSFFNTAGATYKN